MEPPAVTQAHAPPRAAFWPGPARAPFLKLGGRCVGRSAASSDWLRRARVTWGRGGGSLLTAPPAQGPRGPQEGKADVEKKMPGVPSGALANESRRPSDPAEDADVAG